MSEEMAIADELGSLGIDEFIKNLPEFDEISDIDVKLAGEKFKKSFKNFSDKIQIQEDLVKKGFRVLKGTTKVIEKLQDLAYTDFFNFQNLFNEYFHNRIQMIAVVNINGSRELHLLNNSFEDLTRENNPYHDLKYNMDKIGEKISYTKNQYDNTLLEEVTDEVFLRWDVAVQTHNKSQYLPILWYLNGKWSGAKVTNKGSINEAYANFYLNKFNGFTKPGSSHSNVKTFVMNGVAFVDNTSGFAIGDVSYKKIQFGVKGLNASPMRMKQVYLEIDNLLNLLTSGIERTPEALIENLPKTLKTAWAKQAKQLTAEQIKEAVDIMFEQFDNFY